MDNCLSRVLLIIVQLVRRSSNNRSVRCLTGMFRRPRRGKPSCKQLVAMSGTCMVMWARSLSPLNLIVLAFPRLSIISRGMCTHGLENRYSCSLFGARASFGVTLILFLCIVVLSRLTLGKPC